MSVYKPHKSRFYHFDFQIRGVRFTGSTECASKRDADAVEKRKRDEARIEVKALTAQEHAPLTFAVAAARYYLQVGTHLRGDGAKNCMWSISWLEREIGGHTLLSGIDDGLVARLVAIRRGQNVAPATVNRSTTEPLRKILNRARDVWGQNLKKIGSGFASCRWRRRSGYMSTFGRTIGPLLPSLSSPGAACARSFRAKSSPACSGRILIGRRRRSPCSARAGLSRQSLSRRLSGNCSFLCRGSTPTSYSPTSLSVAQLGPECFAQKICDTQSPAGAKDGMAALQA
jgi:hypothetical protein